MNKINPQNHRGDKNVVSGSLKTFFSAIRKKVDKSMKKEIIENINNTLSEKKVKNRTESPIWIFVILQKYMSHAFSIEILNLYI